MVLIGFICRLKKSDDGVLDFSNFDLFVVSGCLGAHDSDVAQNRHFILG